MKDEGGRRGQRSDGRRDGMVGWVASLRDGFPWGMNGCPDEIRFTETSSISWGKDDSRLTAEKLFFDERVKFLGSLVGLKVYFVCQTSLDIITL